MFAKYGKVAAGLLIGGAIAGAVMMGLMPEFPKGGEMGLGLTPATPTTVSRPVETPPATPEPATPSAPSPTTDLVPAPLPEPEVLEVVIEGRDYLVPGPSTSGSDWQVASLDRIVELVQERPGDEDGIRVRISRRGTARATAEEALRERLLAAGLTIESIRWDDTSAP